MLFISIFPIPGLKLLLVLKIQLEMIFTVIGQTGYWILDIYEVQQFFIDELSFLENYICWNLVQNSEIPFSIFGVQIISVFPKHRIQLVILGLFFMPKFFFFNSFITWSSSSRYTIIRDLCNQTWLFIKSSIVFNVKFPPHHYWGFSQLVFNLVYRVVSQLFDNLGLVPLSIVLFKLFLDFFRLDDKNSKAGQSRKGTVDLDILK